MIYLFCGTDFRKVRMYSEKFLEKLFLKKPEAILVEMDDESFTQEKCEECIVSRGLFERYIILVLSRVFENKEAEEYVMENIQLLAGSENVFIFLENELPKKTLSVLEKHAEKTWMLNKKGPSIKKAFNAFSLTDAIGVRDKKRAWVLFQEALAHDVAPENIHGILFWHIKTMLQIKARELDGEKALKALGLKPFVLQKNRSFSRNYSLLELKKLSSRLVEDYHEARRGGAELSLSLERFILMI